jgi:LDH2 family malate/lactate/ureidoglycolate dehydrogenase
MIGLLAGVMNGAAFGHDVVGRIGPLSKPTNTGQTIVVFRPDLFMTAVEFAASMDRHLGELRASAPARGSDPVRLPGERAVELEEEQRRLGIPVPAQLLEDLRRLADELGVADPLS